MSLHWYDRLRKRDPFMGRFCGWTYPYPNLTDSLTQRYLTLIWHTNGIREDKGWRLMATRVWPEADCPGDHYTRCKAENICMDGRLKCDGIKQCDDGSDETECQGWEIIIGGFLVLGTAGVTAISLVLTFVYVCLFFAIRYCIKKLRKRQAQVVVIDIGDKSGADTNAPPPGKGGLLDTSLALMAAKMASAKMAAMSFINKLRGRPSEAVEAQAAPNKGGLPPATVQTETETAKAGNDKTGGQSKDKVKEENKTPLPGSVAPKATTMGGRPKSGAGGTVVVGLAGVTSPRGEGANDKKAGAATAGGQGENKDKTDGKADGKSLTVSPAPDEKKVDLDQIT